MFSSKLAKITIAAIAVIPADFAFANPNAMKTPANAGALAPEQRSAMEGVIRDYLLKNPAIIREAMMALSAQEEMAKRARAVEALKRHRAELLQDAETPVGGNPDGDVTVVEFFDYNCGYCKRAAGALTALVARDPNVRIAYKEFAILGPQSVNAAKAALAAQRQGKYKEFHQGLMAAEKTDDAGIQALAMKLGLNYATLAKDMADPKLGEQLNRTHQLAGSLDINGTPAFIIGERLLPGAVDAEVLVSLVNEERARLRGGGAQKPAAAAAVPAK